MDLNEKAVSKAQQALFGIALSVKRGNKKLEDVPDEHRDKIKDIVDSMSEEDIQKYAETKTEKLPDKVEEALSRNRMPTLQDIYESENMISEADLRKIAEYINTLGYITTIPNSLNTINVSTLVAPEAEKEILKFVSDMKLKADINNGIGGTSTIMITEEGEATLDSTVGRGDISLGNDTSDSDDNTKGSGEEFGNVKKKKTNESETIEVKHAGRDDFGWYMKIGNDEFDGTLSFPKDERGKVEIEWNQSNLPENWEELEQKIIDKANNL
jgi:hypothetical protein